MRENEVERVVVLDDDSDAFLYESPESNFKTTFEFGLTDKIKDQIITYLKKEGKSERKSGAASKADRT